MIIHEIWQHLMKKNPDDIEKLFTDDVRFGTYLCAVKLSDGSYGIASIIEDLQVHCDRKPFENICEIIPKLKYSLYMSNNVILKHNSFSFICSNPYLFVYYFLTKKNALFFPVLTEMIKFGTSVICHEQYKIGSHRS